MAAVLSSGIGPLMVAAVGLAVLARRGWRAALLHTAPPAVVYGVWVLVTHPRDAEFGRPPAVEVWNWIREGQVGTVEALGHFWIVGVLLGLLLVVGLVVLVTSTSVEELRHRGAVPLALLVCGPLFFALTAQGRWYFGAQVARSSRYLYIGAVLLLPALALAGDSLARRWRPVTGLVVLVLLVGVPGNFREFGSSIFNEGFFREQREVALGVPRTAEAEQVPEWVRPLPDQYNGEDLTIGWLLEARDAGRLPVPGDMNPRNVATFPIRVGLAFVDEPPVEDGCRTQTAPLDLSLVEGDRLAIRTSVNVATVADGKPTSRPVRFDPRPSGALSVEVSALDVRFTPVVPGGAFTVCY